MIDWTPGSDDRYILSLIAALLLIIVAFWRSRD